MKSLLAALLGLMLLIQAVPARADSDESTFEQIGYGTGSVLGSAVYFPFKAAFCILGGLGIGPAFLVGGSKAANQVASKACRGTWAITPDVIKGKERVRFVGTVPGEPAAAGRPPAAQQGN